MKSKERKQRAPVIVLPAVCCLAIAACSAPKRDKPQTVARTGTAVDITSFNTHSPGTALPVGWKPWIILPSKRKTEYTFVQENDATVLRAHAQSSASGLYRDVNVLTEQFPVLSWRWRVDVYPPKSDPRKTSTEDSPARILIAFFGG